ncbi:MAG: hypothetical protein GX901_04825 [Lentisphaerae bacterium]|nr:hypothetical protein [Lentisphaerota bacterium]
MRIQGREQWPGTGFTSVPAQYQCPICGALNLSP